MKDRVASGMEYHGRAVALLSSAVREDWWRLEVDRHEVFLFALGSLRFLKMP